MKKNVTFHTNYKPKSKTRFPFSNSLHFFRSALTDYNVTPEPMHTRVFVFIITICIHFILAGCLCVSWGLSVEFSQAVEPNEQTNELFTLTLNVSTFTHRIQLKRSNHSGNRKHICNGWRRKIFDRNTLGTKQRERDRENIITGSLMFEGNPYHRMK